MEDNTKPETRMRNLKGLYFAAASTGNISLLQRLNRHGILPDERNLQGATPLMIASLHGQSKAVTTLIAFGADACTQDNEGMTALMHACTRSGNQQVVEFLLEHGADRCMDLTDSMGRTALIWAAMSDVDNVRTLLRYSPNIDHITDSEENALTFAIVWGKLEIVKCLLEAGADKEWKDSAGWSARSYAAEAGCTEMLRLLNDKQ